MIPSATLLDSIKNYKGQDFIVESDNYNVLLIGCRDCFTIKLLGGDFKLTYAANIHEARKIIQNSLNNELFFDTIICDAGIEEKSILHFARYLSATETICRLPFILFTNTNVRELYTA